MKRLLILGALLLIALPAQAAIAAGTKTTGQGENVSSITFSHTCETGSNRFLFVGVSSSLATGSTSTVTYNGVSMTEKWDLNGGAGNPGQESGHILIAPDEGAHNVVVTLSASSANFNATAICFTGVDQTTPTGTAVTNLDSAGNGTNSVTVTTATGEVIIDLMVDYESSVAMTAGANQTEIEDIAGLNVSFRSGLSTQNGADGGVMSWTCAAGTESILGAIPIKPAAEGGATRNRIWVSSLINLYIGLLLF